MPAVQLNDRLSSKASASKWKIMVHMCIFLNHEKKSFFLNIKRCCSINLLIHYLLINKYASKNGKKNLWKKYFLN